MLQEICVLYVSNLQETITEMLLVKVFGRFGPLKMVKLLLPRNEQEV
ncbi:MAG: hypothetical protein ACKO96_30720 [Flammeovirgaceae bacterium]